MHQPPRHMFDLGAQSVIVARCRALLLRLVSLAHLNSELHKATCLNANLLLYGRQRCAIMATWTPKLLCAIANMKVHVFATVDLSNSQLSPGRTMAINHYSSR